YLTLPDGRRVGFTFTPQRHEQTGLVFYTPAWQADPGAGYTLSSAGAMLSKAGDRFYGVQTGLPYNPASGRFSGPDYTLTGPGGVIYFLSATNGVVEQVLPNGERLVFSDSGVTHSNGAAVRFTQDAMDRMIAIIAPDDTRVLYSYDAE